jgi:hypothetical protein
MKHPTIYMVKPEQVGGEDLQEFLRKQIKIQFGNREYYVAKEEIIEKPTHYSKTPRKLRGFLINENNQAGHAIWFDVTDVKTVEWVA